MGIIWHDWFVYDNTSPSCLRWKVERRSGKNGCRVNTQKGDIAGCLSDLGYYKVGLFNTNHSVHRIVWEMFNGEIPPKMVIDHVDGNRSHNILPNLRVVDPKTNGRNRKKSKNSYTKVGVTRRVSRGLPYWNASCRTLDGKIWGKCFSINRYGEEKAFALACECRDDKIRELNALGAGYTERHGT